MKPLRGVDLIEQTPFELGNNLGEVSDRNGCVYCYVNNARDVN